MFRKTLATLPTQASRMLNATARPSSFFATRMVAAAVSQTQSRRTYHEKDKFPFAPWKVLVCEPRTHDGLYEPSFLDWRSQ